MNDKNTGVLCFIETGTDDVYWNDPMNYTGNHLPPNPPTPIVEKTKFGKQIDGHVMQILGNGFLILSDNNTVIDISLSEFVEGIGDSENIAIKLASPNNPAVKKADYPNETITEERRGERK